MIRNELDVLLEKVEDEALRADLRTQIDRLKERRSYGLVFERHIPERVRLPQRAIRVGSRVVSRDGDDNPTWEVAAIEGDTATLVAVRDAQGAYIQVGEHGDIEHASIDSLVVISEFGEPVLPGLRHLGSVERGGDKPYHVVVKGENHHALEALRFTHAGKVDCIYIDPPYNSGARDWKYNNDYVDDNDAYRHSKWLAFMERRLKLAKELLNPDDSVLIVTIDEREGHRLGMLLTQTFPSSRLQMVATVTNPKGVPVARGLSRVEEWIFFVMFGEASPARWISDMMGESHGKARATVRYVNLKREGSGWRRQDRPGLFYPLFVDPSTGRIDDVGEPLPLGHDREAVEGRVGFMTVWPLKPNGDEARWQQKPASARKLLAAGLLRSRLTSDRRGVIAEYLSAGQQRFLADGRLVATGHDENGALVVRRGDGGTEIAKTVWRLVSHSATEHGSKLLSRIVPGRAFPFPKSLYAVEDTIRFFVKDKPDAIVLDFFAGSGTTAHAVMRLNRQDGGRRQSIMVTNNDVSVDEAAALRKRGLRPGDPNWEALGIFEHITRPRVEAAVTGNTPSGKPIKGDYKFTDEFPMSEGLQENVEFLELTYLDPDSVDLGLAFDDLAALLWLRAGAQGAIARSTDEEGKPVSFAWTDHYGVIFDTDQWRAFVSKRPESARTAFVVTYSPAVFASIAAELPTGMDVVRLYDSYLARFMTDRATD